MARFRKSVALDLGGSSVLVALPDKGIVLDEPSVISKDILTGKVLAVGNEAKKLLGKTPGNVISVRPIKEGIISSSEECQEMLKYYLGKSFGKNFLKPDVLIAVPSKATQVEKRAVLQAAENAGAHRAYFVEEALAAGLGAGVEINDDVANLIVDIGAGTTDIAVITEGQVITSDSVDAGGDNFDKRIKDFIRNRYDLLIGEKSAEEIKIKASSLKFDDRIEVRGREAFEGLPEKVYVSVEDIYQAILSEIDKVIGGVKNILEQTPPELAADLFDRGVILTGGASLSLGLAQRMRDELELEVMIAEDPRECVIKGVTKALTWIDSLDEEKSEAVKRKQKELENNERMRRR